MHFESFLRHTDSQKTTKKQYWLKKQEKKKGFFWKRIYSLCRWW